MDTILEPMLNHLNRKSHIPRNSALIVRLIASMALISMLGIQTAEAVSPGTKCSKLGQTVVSNGKKLTCSLMWAESAGNKAPATSSKDESKGSTLQSKSFRLESVSFNNDLGSAGATARVINISRSTKTATMSIAVFGPDGKTVLFNMMGVVNAVPAGQTVTATFTSISGEFPGGQFKYSFQVDAEF